MYCAFLVVEAEFFNIIETSFTFRGLKQQSNFKTQNGEFLPTYTTNAPA
jgi:hypothetical protein